MLQDAHKVVAQCTIDKLINDLQVIDSKITQHSHKILSYLTYERVTVEIAPGYTIEIIATSPSKQVKS